MVTETTNIDPEHEPEADAQRVVGLRHVDARLLRSLQLDYDTPVDTKLRAVRARRDCATVRHDREHTAAGVLDLEARARGDDQSGSHRYAASVLKVESSRVLSPASRGGEVRSGDAACARADGEASSNDGVAVREMGLREISRC
jgi:hypothetical protein